MGQVNASGCAEQRLSSFHRLRLRDHWPAHFYKDESPGRGWSLVAVWQRRQSSGEVLFVGLILIRVLFVFIVTGTCYLIEPFGLPARLDGELGAVIGLAIVLFEWSLRRASLKRLI